MEDVVLLRHQHDLRAQPLGAEVSDRDAADGHRTGTRFVDSGQQPPERRLPRARYAHDRKPLARLHREIDAVQHVAALVVGVPNIGNADPVVGRFGIVHRSGSSQAGEALDARE